MKKCITCEEVKELSEFYNEKRRKDGKKSVCKDCCKIKTKQWIEKNKERYQKVARENGKVYYKNNKESIKDKVKKYRDSNKDRYKEYYKLYCQKNKEKINEYNLRRNILHKKIKTCEIPENKKQCCNCKKLVLKKSFRKRKNGKHITFRPNCNSCEINLSKKYRDNSKDSVKKSRIKSYKKMKNCYILKLKHNLRISVYRSFKKRGYTKKSKTELILGADWLTVKKHFERQFTKGMTWDNQGKWHIDHIVPLASAKTEEEVIKLNHYTNLQPLWAEDNLKKSDTIINGTQTTLGI